MAGFNPKQEMRREKWLERSRLGTFEVRLDLDEVKRSFDGIAEDRFRSVMRRTVAEAKKLSPVRFGHNRSSITAQFTNNDGHSETVGGEEESGGAADVRLEPNDGCVYTQSGYGGYLEVGTQTMDARPYIWPAFVDSYKRLVR